MSLDFVAIDFETANGFRGSPCAVGLTRVLDGVITDNLAMLMRPPLGRDHFAPMNISIHGITPDMVQDAPEFAECWPAILKFIDGLPVVAHNAAFDLGVIREACIFSGIPWPTLRYVCTLVLARRSYDLLSYSLPFVAQAAGHTLRHHHDAGADASTAALIMLDIAARREASSLEAVFGALGAGFGILNPEMWSGCRLIHSGAQRRLPDVNPNADPCHPLFGEVVVFTGALQTMTREVAWNQVAFVGGQAGRSPTKRTTILVEGMQDPTKLRPGMVLSLKAEKVAGLRAKGQQVEIMSEPQFLALIADDSGSGFRADVVNEQRHRAWREGAPLLSTHQR